jgi:hydroxymethylpyrimidine/phosphomethylpyrimidine kinase
VSSRNRVGQSGQVLLISGFDPSGRAGLLADLWAVRSTGARAVGVVTAITAQGEKFVCAPVAPKLLDQQLSAALGSAPVDAAKLGMIADRRALSAIVDRLQPHGFPIVIDPVVHTSRGEPLSSLSPRDYLQLGHRLRRRHLVITPNRDELTWLGASATDLLAIGFSGVIVKGSDCAVDEVFTAEGRLVLRGARLPRNTLHHRGTGCRFGSGLAAALGCGEDLVGAARTAKRLVRKFLRGPILP